MPAWRHTVNVSDVFHDDSLGLPEKGEAIVARLEALRLKSFPDDDEFGETLEELLDAARKDDVQWFDNCWSEVYDWADANRVWIRTI